MDINNIKDRKRIAFEFMQSSEICADFKTFLEILEIRNPDISDNFSFARIFDTTLNWECTVSGYLRCAYVHAKWIVFLMKHYPTFLSIDNFSSILSQAIARVCHEVISCPQIKNRAKYIRFFLQYEKFIKKYD